MSHSHPVSFGLGQAFTQKKAEPKLHPDVDEMCKFLVEEFEGKVDERWLNVGGFSGSRKQLESRLDHYKHHLSNYMLEVPREEGESIDAYHQRLGDRKGDRCHSVMYVIANLGTHFLQEEAREARARRQAEQERKALEKAQRKELGRRASPDPEQIKRLLGVIESASESEELLASIAAALDKHRAAEDARQQLRDIFGSELSACEQLDKRAPSREPVPEAEQGALDFALSIRRANAPPPRIYKG